MTNDFGKYPSKKLQEIYAKRPFQLQEPEKAKIIFLGFDADWKKNIEENKVFFNETIEYLEYRVKYWKKYEIHTLMLKDYFNGAEKSLYHSKNISNSFRKI